MNNIYKSINYIDNMNKKMSFIFILSILSILFLSISVYAFESPPYKFETTITCSEGSTFCSGYEYYVCENGNTYSRGYVVGKCGFSEGTLPDCPSGSNEYVACPDGFSENKLVRVCVGGKWYTQPNRDYSACRCQIKGEPETGKYQYCKLGYECLGDAGKGLCYKINVEKPIKPTPPKIEVFVNKIISFIRKLFSQIFVQQTIIGDKIVEPNTLATYQIDISTNIPDKNYSDGTYQVQYGAWALVDKDGNILKNSDWEEINGEYKKSVTITTPNNIGDYALIGLIEQFDMDYSYNNKVWNSKESIANKEAINLETKYSIIEPEKPSPYSISSILGSIKSFICNNFGFFC